MAFFVVVRLQIRPERLSNVLTLIDHEYEWAPSGQLGRRRARVFQRLGSPTELLGCIEWNSQQAYARYRRSSTHQALLADLAGPSHAQYCTCLVSFERMFEQSEVAACGGITIG